jgi:transposase
MIYLSSLREIVKNNGSQDIVYIDESGFEENVCRIYGWGKIGQKISGEKSGTRGKRTNLIAARRGKEFLAPMLFSGTAHTELVNEYVKTQLCQILRPNSTIIMDNAGFHNKSQLVEIAKENGHQMLFLPPYSPDFNPIEQDFANIKKRRVFAENISLEDIIKLYNC